MQHSSSPSPKGSGRPGVQYSGREGQSERGPPYMRPHRLPGQRGGEGGVASARGRDSGRQWGLL